jgi:hypothetical protein
MIGNATGHPGRSLYITDNGASNNYSGSASTVFATYALRFDTVGHYVCSFDWRCNGEVRYDYLRAAIVPAYTVLEPGNLGGFDENEVRTMGRVSTGVIGMRLDGGDDEVVGMVCVNDPNTETIMVVSENGYGKRSEIEDYRKTSRGTKGVKTLAITEKTGRLVAIKVVTDDNDLMIINKSGVLIRLKVADVRVMGRATQGVRLINLTKKNDSIASVCKVTSSQEEDVEEAEIVDEELTDAIDTPQISPESED